MSLPARYARAIVAHRFGPRDKAIALIDDLLKEQPNNPYFWELKGQALLESAQPRAAIAPLRKAVSMLPNAGLIRAMLGRALLATDDPKLADEAIRELSNAAQREPDSSDTYRDLGIAYGRRGDIGLAEVNTALAFFKEAQWDQAATLASRAQAKLPVGSPGWVKAKDILDYRPPRTALNK
jgi:predicted Zn-dependent protease